MVVEVAKIDGRKQVSEMAETKRKEMRKREEERREKRGREADRVYSIGEFCTDDHYNEYYFSTFRLDLLFDYILTNQSFNI
jgi:hypothetical protein